MDSTMSDASRMEELLVQMITRVEEQRLLVEHKCSILTELLKPWPQETHTKEEAVTQEAEETNANENNPEKDLSQADLLALDQANQLLNKARWTRVSKSKKTVKADDAVFPEAEVAGPVVENHANINTNKGAHADKSNKSNDCVGSQNVSTVSAEKHSSLRSKKPAREIHTVKSGQVKKVPAHPSCPVPQSTRKSISRPSSAMSSGSFVRKKEYVPAHVKAPFKTDVNSRVPNRKANHLKKNQSCRKVVESRSSAVPKTQQSHPLEATHFKTLPGIRAQTETGEPYKISSRKIESNVLSSDKDLSQVSETQASHTFETTDRCAESKAEDRNPGLASEKSYCHEEETDCKTSFKVKTFNLKDNSCDLKIPVKLKKLYSTNVMLLKQCHDSKLRKKVSDADPAHSFMAKLKSQTEIHEELWIRERALSCLKAHNLMHEILQSLQLHTITEKSSYEEMYRAKKMLEFILFMFGKLEEEADYFSRVQFRPLAPSSVDSCVDESPFHWLTNFVGKAISDTQAPYSSESSESRILQLNLGCSRQWIHLKFMEIFYKVQQSILKMAEKEWWHLVSSDLSSRDLSVLQLVHGLMTTIGEHLPIHVENLSS